MSSKESPAVQSKGVSKRSQAKMRAKGRDTPSTNTSQATIQAEQLYKPSVDIYAPKKDTAKQGYKPRKGMS